MTTGKNKEKFEKWYNEFSTYGTIIMFRSLPFEMKLGVFLTYYDSLDILISVEYYDTGAISEEGYYFKCGKKSFYWDNVFNTRNEAFKEAFKEADKIVNNQLNK